jgi:hypothetical protein
LQSPEQNFLHRQDQGQIFSASTACLMAVIAAHGTMRLIFSSFNHLLSRQYNRHHLPPVKSIFVIVF